MHFLFPVAPGWLAGWQTQGCIQGSLVDMPVWKRCPWSLCPSVPTFLFAADFPPKPLSTLLFIFLTSILCLFLWNLPWWLRQLSLSATQETRIRSLGWKDPLEKEMATHFSILAWKKSHEQRSLAGYSPRGHKELDTTE